VKYKFLL
jgi:dynein heavy chain, axonemal